MTEFKKGDLIKDGPNGVVFRVTGVATYLVQGHNQATTIDWDDAVEPTKEEAAAFEEKDRQKATANLIRAQYELHAAQALYDRVHKVQEE